MGQRPPQPRDENTSATGQAVALLQDMEAMVLTQHRERRALESSDLGGGSQLLFLLLCDFRQVL